MPPTDSLPFANENQLLGKEERIECNQEIDSVSDETTDDDGDSICSEASDTETVDTQRNASGLSIGDNSFLSDEYTFVHLEETFNPVNVSGLEENEQDLRTSIEPKFHFLYFLTSVALRTHSRAGTHHISLNYSTINQKEVRLRVL
jgi:hypothetical protein